MIIKDLALFYNLPSSPICQVLRLYIFYDIIQTKKDKPGVCVSFISV